MKDGSASLPAALDAAAPPRLRAARIRIDARLNWSTTIVVGIAASVVVVLLAVFAYVIASSQATSRSQARQRFEAQATIAASLTQALLASAAVPEERTASAAYGSSSVDPRQLVALARSSHAAFVSVAARDGRIIASSPISAAQSSAAAPITRSAIAHAATGRPWLSDLVPAPGHHYLVEDAIPFPTAFGLRVLILGDPASALTTFLNGTLAGGLPVKSEHGFVIDGHGRIVASSVAGVATGLGIRNDEFLRALTSQRGGYDATKGARYLVAAPIDGSAWRVAITEPIGTLYPAVVGSQMWVIWMIFGAFALAAACGLILYRRTLIGADRMVEQAKLVETTNEALIAANAELDSFSYSVSHDLRAPLRAIDGFSQIVIEEDGGQLTDAQRRYLGLVRQSTQTMGALIDDLLAFSRLSNRPLERRPVDTAELVRDIENELVGRIDPAEIQLSNGELPTVEADPALLRQVFANLIENAVKYSRSRRPATVWVGSEIRGGELVFIVRDNGVGFDMRYADKLFQVFQRLHRVEEYPGTGVGLAIVHRIVARHQGRIWAESEPDAGATFFFTLARAPAANVRKERP